MKLKTMREKFSACHLILKSFFYSKGAIFMQNFPRKLNFSWKAFHLQKRNLKRRKNFDILNPETEVESHHKIYMLLPNGWVFFRASSAWRNDKECIITHVGARNNWFYFWEHARTNFPQVFRPSQWPEVNGMENALYRLHNCYSISAWPANICFYSSPQIGCALRLIEFNMNKVKRMFLEKEKFQETFLVSL